MLNTLYPWLEHVASPGRARFSHHGARPPAFLTSIPGKTGPINQGNENPVNQGNEKRTEHGGRPAKRQGRGAPGFFFFNRPPSQWSGRGGAPQNTMVPGRTARPPRLTPHTRLSPPQNSTFFPSPS